MNIRIFLLSIIFVTAYTYLYLDGNRGEAKRLELAHSKIVKVVIENNFKSLVIPPISTGIYRFPLREAAQIAFKTVTNSLTSSSYGVEVYFAMKELKKYKINLEEFRNVRNQLTADN